MRTRVGSASACARFATRLTCSRERRRIEFSERMRISEYCSSDWCVELALLLTSLPPDAVLISKADTTLSKQQKGSFDADSDHRWRRFHRLASRRRSDP